MDRQTDGVIDKQTKTLTDRLAHGRVDRQTVKETGKQVGQEGAFVLIVQISTFPTQLSGEGEGKFFLS